MKDNQKYQIELTRKQFRDLMKVVYLGNWMANAYRTVDVLKGYQAIEDWVFSYAKLFGYAEYVDHSIRDEHYYPTALFEETQKVHAVREEYDEEMFWDALIERLTIMQLAETITPEEDSNMDREERFKRYLVMEEKVAKIINEKGLGALVLQEDG